MLGLFGIDLRGSDIAMINARNVIIRLALQAVEQFDKLRVEELRRAFWVYANLGSIAAVADDNSNEHVRASLVNVDAEKDMLQFVITARTGSVRPGR